MTKRPDMRETEAWLVRNQNPRKHSWLSWNTFLPLPLRVLTYILAILHVRFKVLSALLLKIGRLFYDVASCRLANICQSFGRYCLILLNTWTYRMFCSLCLWSCHVTTVTCNRETQRHFLLPKQGRYTHYLTRTTIQRAVALKQNPSWVRNNRFVERPCSLPRSQQPDAGPFPKPHESSSYCYFLFL